MKAIYRVRAINMLFSVIYSVILAILLLIYLLFMVNNFNFRTSSHQIIIGILLGATCLVFMNRWIDKELQLLNNTARILGLIIAVISSMFGLFALSLMIWIEAPQAILLTGVYSFGHLAIIVALMKREVRESFKQSLVDSNVP